MRTSTTISTLLAITTLAAAAPSAFADAPSTPGGTNYGHGEVKSCTTAYQAGVAGRYGAWGRYVDGCTVKVKCYFAEGCTVGGRGVINDDRFDGLRVTLNSRLRILDSYGRKVLRRWDRSCDSSNFCSAGHIDADLPKGNVASVQCNGVHQLNTDPARVSCQIFVSRGSLSRECPDADTPVNALSDQAAEASVLCLTNRERRAANLPGLIYNRSLSDAAGAHAADAVAAPWWTGNNAHDNPYTGTRPADRIVASGYCPAPKYLGLERPENAFTGGAWGQGAAAPTPRKAVQWWMNHHIEDGFPAEQNGHRMAILNPTAVEIGNGVVNGDARPNSGSEVGGTFVQDFGNCVN
jgi:uncharacterized protein YkwD